VRFRSGIIAIAALGAVSSAVVAGAGSASAVTGSLVCDDGGYCLGGTGYLSPIVVNHEEGSGLVQVNKTTWPGNSRTVYEYQAGGTSLCLEYDGTESSNFVRFDTCTKGRQSQEFWRGSEDNELINVYASGSGTNQFGRQACLDATNSAGTETFIALCEEASTQVWNW